MLGARSFLPMISVRILFTIVYANNKWNVQGESLGTWGWTRLRPHNRWDPVWPLFIFIEGGITGDRCR